MIFETVAMMVVVVVVVVRTTEVNAVVITGKLTVLVMVGEAVIVMVRVVEG